MIGTHCAFVGACNTPRQGWHRLEHVTAAAIMQIVNCLVMVEHISSSPLGAFVVIRLTLCAGIISFVPRQMDGMKKRKGWHLQLCAEVRLESGISAGGRGRGRITRVPVWRWP